MPHNLATRYADAMREHPYGRALYEPEPADILKAGSCGYLNDMGRWQPILNDIAKKEDLLIGGFTTPGTLISMPERKYEWGPKTSSAVSFTKTAIEAGASALPAGVPVGARIVLDFESSSDFGSILHCPKEVVENGYFHRQTFLQWAKVNSAAIIKAQSEVKSQGVWVVTSVYATHDVWLNAWTGKEKRVKMGFAVNAQPAGEIGPSGEFLRGSSAGSGWNHAMADTDDKKLVVFFSGVRLKYRWLPFGKSSLHEVRGEEPVVVTDPSDEQNMFQVEYEYVGPEPELSGGF